ncbi:MULTISPECIES: HEPN domain-containing protein [Limnospira]|uniref:HEPN domain-containing protein n=2 Tax=Limnospira TaxID=2596745 RepID=A0A9P1NWJ0_9CYAN|nr:MULTISPECIES: HEPN domain-containing protein [Limnospira]MDY7052097.1 HEPN domain-containing protein [Limnospira fusiformis LS22]QJB28583.1 HEPN domain-containing protein [Limnospira fusiformis SAG 85.79]UWU51216.1 HEPN domain-containing protein [Arthrospira platensis C1]MDT9190804.1 HEPN domain-containing protein [Limnospira sp. PMC 894.15]MDT9236710.1 HEPN domain-containing protein [Limnospira sp. PMC 917.15]
MPPSKPQDWINLANERAADADEISKTRKTSVASVYLAGYAIECSLKALLQERGTGFPKHGQQGHNLRELWESANFRLSDLSDPTGAKTFYLEKWNTSLRYEVTCDSLLSHQELVEKAKQLTGWIQTQMRRTRPRRPR